MMKIFLRIEIFDEEELKVYNICTSKNAPRTLFDKSTKHYYVSES